MKIISRFKVLHFILTTVLISGFGLGTHAAAQEHAYLIDLNSKTATDIGTLGGSVSHASGINDAGQVVGYSYMGAGAQHAFITGPNGVGMRDLGTLSDTTNSIARGINDAGQVVGSSYVTAEGTHHAFITGPNGMGMRDLGTLGGNYSQAYGINGTGQVVGYSQTAGGATHAFITGPNGMGMRDLGTLEIYPGSPMAGQSVAYGINDAGQVVGLSNTGGRGAFWHAFTTGANGMGMRDLGTLNRDDFSNGNGINNVGQVVGVSLFSGAFITGLNGEGMRGLGDLGGRYSDASGINDAGQVVGWARTQELARHAFITGSNGAGMMDLASVVHLPDGRVLEQATGINNSGQVIAIGVIPAVPVVPEPESYALFLAGLALLGFVARRKKMSGEAFRLG